MDADPLAALLAARVISPDTPYDPAVRTALLQDDGLMRAMHAALGVDGQPPEPPDADAVKMIATYTAGATLADVARQYGVSGPAVRAVLVAARVPIRRAVHPRKARTMVGDELREAVRLYQIGWPVDRVCRQIGGIGTQSMRQQLADAGVKIRPGGWHDLRVVLEAAPGTPPGTLPAHYKGQWISRLPTDLAATLAAFRLTATPTGRAATNADGEGAEILEVRPAPGWTPPGERP